MDINEVIPPELLLLILDQVYVEAIDSISLAPSTAPPLNHHPLLNTMLVCRSWHQMIMSTPVFWTFVWIGAGTPPRDVEGKRLRAALERSGQLPLSVMMAPERIERLIHFPNVQEALEDHLQRVEAFSFVRMERKRQNIPSGRDIELLLGHPLPSLKRLNVDRFKISYTGYWWSDQLRITIDSPQLEELSCHYHFIIPQSPLHLTSISLSSVDSPTDSFTPKNIDLPLLLDLRLTKCNVATLLSAFVTPSLRRLFVDENGWRISTAPSLRPYPKLEELQWNDEGPDPTFSALLPLCPNLIRYSKYQVGGEENPGFQEIETPATILGVLAHESGDNHGPSASSWPKLEEVLLDAGKCDDVFALLDAIPSIKRVRILQSSTERSDEETQKREADLFLSLRKLVDIVFGLDSWGSIPGTH
ncbi:hypothetical protein FRC00_009631 [Tulasnella sp. 408]|nr:hypothetical protein FRC00_009631 [Tulasnella sp. 408]